MDETTAPVLDPGRGVTKTGYLWALARDDTYLARPQEGLRQGPVLVCSPAKAKWRQTGNG
jgi:hypothetical protein